MIDYLQTLINEEIPIAEKMGIVIDSYQSDKIKLRVPFDGNKNHKNTAFGGSIYSALALSGWGLLAANIREHDLQGEVVIHEANIEYMKPINTDFEVVCSIDNKEDIDQFLDQLKSRGKAKINVTSKVMLGEESVVQFTGAYVAIA